MYQTKFRSNAQFISDEFLTRNLSVDETATASGISRPTLYRLLKSRQNIRYETAQKLTKFFGRGAVTTNTN